MCGLESTLSATLQSLKEARYALRSGTDYARQVRENLKRIEHDTLSLMAIAAPAAC